MATDEDSGIVASSGNEDVVEDTPYEDEDFRADNSDDDLEISFVDIVGDSQSPDLRGLLSLDVTALRGDQSLPGSSLEADGTLSRSPHEKEDYRHALAALNVGDLEGSEKNADYLFDSDYQPQFEELHSKLLENRLEEEANGVGSIPTPITVDSNSLEGMAGFPESDEEDGDYVQGSSEDEYAYSDTASGQDVPVFPQVAAVSADFEDGPPKVPDVIPSMDEPFPEGLDAGQENEPVPTVSKKIMIGLGGVIQPSDLDPSENLDSGGRVPSVSEEADPLDGGPAPLPIMTPAVTSVNPDSVFVSSDPEPEEGDSSDVDTGLPGFEEVGASRAATSPLSPPAASVVPAPAQPPVVPAVPAVPVVIPKSPIFRSQSGNSFPELKGPGFAERVLLPDGTLNLRETLLRSMSDQERDLFIKRESVIAYMSRGGSTDPKMDELLLSAYSRFELRELMAYLNAKLSSEFGALSEHTALLQQLHDALLAQAKVASGIPEEWNRIGVSLSTFVDSFMKATSEGSEASRQLRQKLPALLQDFDSKLAQFSKEISAFSKNRQGGSTTYRFVVLGLMACCALFSGFSAFRQFKGSSPVVPVSSEQGVLEAEGLTVKVLRSKEGPRYFQVLDKSGKPVPFVDYAGGKLGRLPDSE